MASAQLAASAPFSSTQTTSFENEMDEAQSNRRVRLHRIVKRLLLEAVIRTALLVVFWFCLPKSVENELGSANLRTIAPLLLLVVLPEFLYKLLHWNEARRAVADMWAFGKLSYRDLSRKLDGQRTVLAEVRESNTYIDVMHGQIGDSLAESEREVMKVIEEIGQLNAGAMEKRKHIFTSIQSSKALADGTRQRVDANREIIAALELQLQEQNTEMHSNFGRIENLARDIGSLAPLIQVITSIAKQTSLLALNAEIEATRAGSAGRGFGVVAIEVRKLSVLSTKAATDIATKINSTCKKVDTELEDARMALEQYEANTGMHNLIAGLSDMQQEFSQNSDLLLEVISEVDQSYGESIHRLTEALGHIQFQDVMRQRMEHVQVALKEMRDHLQLLTVLPGDPDWDGRLERTFGSLLSAHLDQYHMESQTATHLALSGQAAQANQSRPAIELF
jgi:methyl-accepting chemotaxis protein